MLLGVTNDLAQHVFVKGHVLSASHTMIYKTYLCLPDKLTHGLPFYRPINALQVYLDVTIENMFWQSKLKLSILPHPCTKNDHRFKHK